MKVFRGNVRGPAAASVAATSLVLAACGVWEDVVAADGDAAEPITVTETTVIAPEEPSPTDSPRDDAEAAEESGDDDSGITDVDPEIFAVNDTGKYAWVLEDGTSICWVMESGSSIPGISCSVQLDDPPKDPTNGQPATKFGITPDGEATLRPDIAGVTPFDYQTLGAGERVSVNGATCTAHGGSDITCEMGGETVEIRDGKTPDIPVVDGMGGD